MKKVTQTLLAKLFVATLFAGSLQAGEDSGYIGIKYASMDTSKTVYGRLDDGTTSYYSSYTKGEYQAYDSVSEQGIELYTINRYDKPVLFGFGVDVLFNKGDFLKGGMVDTDVKLGTYYKDFSLYGLYGFGLQSLSAYTVAVGSYYGAAINYDLAESAAIKVEYRSHTLLTTHNEATTSDQAYTLSGITATIAYKF